jgi:MFS superfamily sulfate permease-like transporter
MIAMRRTLRHPARIVPIAFEAAGALQVLLGALRLGRWFRAISSSVVLGMLAGIGVVLVVGQAYALFDRRAPGGTPANLAGLPAVVGGVPAGAALAGVLVHAGLKLVPLRTWAGMWRASRGEALVLTATAVMVVATSLLEGVVAGLLLALAKCAWEVSHLHVDVEEGVGIVRVRLSGNATFIRLPRMVDALDAVPGDRPVALDLSGLRRLDDTCRAAAARLGGTPRRRRRRGTPTGAARPRYPR